MSVTRTARVVGVLMMAWAAMPAFASAAGPQAPKAPATAGGPGRAGAPVYAEIVDQETGGRMRATRLATGAIQFDVTGRDVRVRKTLDAQGSFEVVFTSGRDTLTLTHRSGVLRLVRAGCAVELDIASPVPDDLRAAHELLAGSDAVRQFRALRSMMAARTLRSSVGGGVAVIDALLSVIKGEAPVVQREPAGSGPVAPLVAFDGEFFDGPTCYEAWQGEVVAAWKDYTGCVLSFPWYDPMRELCAFAWILRVESAWFQFLGCSSVPFKRDLQDAEPLVACR